MSASGAELVVKRGRLLPLYPDEQKFAGSVTPNKGDYR